MKKLLFLVLFAGAVNMAMAQGTFSGDLQMNLNCFQRDTNIRASGNPLYDNYLSGSEAWLSLRYSVKGFTFFLRGDAFNNSNLKNPTQANTNFGVGAWNITKEMKDLTISFGYIYDQIGSGILFRAYEDRGLLIDNALVGLELKYKLTKNISLKGFTGQQKDNDLASNQLSVSQRYAPIIKGFNAEGDFTAGKVHILPGVGFLNRTLDQVSMNSVVSTINSISDTAARFYPKYNMYAFALYNTLSIGNFSWYAEGDYKTHEAIVNLDGSLIDKPGNVEYTNISYAQKGIAINLAGKRTENFVMRTSPNESLTNGMLNWQPVVAVLRPERLMSRYTPASQDISEIAGTANVFIAPNDVTNFTATYSHINQLDNTELYREVYAEGYYQGLKSWIFQGGVQYLEYNANIYYTRPTATMVYAITPFAEVTYRFNEKHSLRGEFQYMNTKQDYGSWLFALLEYDVAPKWSVAASDMYNITPNNSASNPNYIAGTTTKANHYYNLYVAYTKGANRFSLAYVKQVDGINCSGGVCRYEPAFSGVKATVTSSF